MAYNLDMDIPAGAAGAAAMKAVGDLLKTPVGGGDGKSGPRVRTTLW